MSANPVLEDALPLVPQRPLAAADGSLLDDELLTFSEVARELPRRRCGSKTATSTIWRWSKRGCRGVHLRVVRVGGNVYVPRSALIEFIDRLSGVDRAPQQPSPTTRSTRAMRELRRMGM